jgi:outer membrane immunogenic protein
VKKLLLASIAFTALIAGSATAADLARPVYRRAGLAAPIYTWTGFYIGGNVGGAWGTFDAATTTVGGGYFITTDPAQIAAAGAQTIKSSGLTGGFEAGYNWQAGNIVFGLEGDIEAFRLSGSATSGPIVYLSAAPAAFIASSNASTDWLATARGRIGIAATNWLFFATGGAAFTTLNGNFTFRDNFLAPPGAAESASFSNTKAGYTVGGGIEASLSGHWSIKAEYLYVNFGTASAVSNNLTFSPAALPGNGQNPFTHSIDLRANIVRVGLNYKFGNYYAPVR